VRQNTKCFIITVDETCSYFLRQLSKKSMKRDLGRAVAQLVEALRYKPEGRGFIPDGVIGIFY
jgi:hypothetical protein